ncbi:MAG: ROK family protein [Desulfurococcaceae archaeon]
MSYYIAIDIGATKTRIAMCNVDGILEKKVLPTPRTGDEYTVARFLIENIEKSWGNSLGDVKAVGVATIGPLDIKRGRIINPANIEIRISEILGPLRTRLGKPVYVLNDAVAAVWAEKHYGDGQSYDNVVYITMSTGIGGGIIVDGNLLIGKNGNAHEIGHIVVDFNSNLRCGCGGYGHWESYAGGANIPKVAKHLYDIRGDNYYSGSKLASMIKSGEPFDAKVVFDLFRNRDQLAIDVVNMYIKASGAGLASVINSYDPELITIGGGVFLNNADILLDPMIKRAVVDIITDKPVIKPTRLGEDIGLYGALSVAIDPPPALIRVQKP